MTGISTLHAPPGWLLLAAVRGGVHRPALLHARRHRRANATGVTTASVNASTTAVVARRDGHSPVP